MMDEFKGFIWIMLAYLLLIGGFIVGLLILIKHLFF